MVIKVNGYSFRGSNSAFYGCGLDFKLGLLLKERIYSCRSKFFLFTVDFFGMRAYFDRKDNT